MGILLAVHPLWEIFSTFAIAWAASGALIRVSAKTGSLLLFLGAPVHLGGQLVQLRARLIHGPGQLCQVHLHLPQLRRHVGGGGFKGGHQRHILGPEQLYRPAQLGGGVSLQLRGPFVGITLDVSHPVPELGVGLCLRPELFQLRPQALGLSLAGLQLPPGRLRLLQLGLGLLPQGALRLQPGLELPDLGAQALRLSLQAVALLLELLPICGRFLGCLLDITDHVLLVKSAERNCFECIVVHNPGSLFPAS